MNLIFEQSTQNHQCSILPPCDVPQVALPTKRPETLNLPELSEIELNRIQTQLQKI